MLPGCRYKKFTQIQPPLENFMTYVEPGGGPPDDDDSRQKIRPAGPLMTMTRRFGRNGTVVIPSQAIENLLEMLVDTGLNSRHSSKCEQERTLSNMLSKRLYGHVAL